MALPGKVDSSYQKLRCGSDYGGWTICPEHINSASLVYSFGVGEDISFDLSLIERFGCRIIAFDPTPRSIQWVKEQRLPANLEMHPFGVAAFDGEALFYPPDNPDHVSHTIVSRGGHSGKAIRAPMRRLSSIMHSLGHSKIDILKMDIEGAEYEVLKDAMASKIDVSQILVEFYHRFSDIGPRPTLGAVNLLRKNGYALFSVSRSREEFSFIKKESMFAWPLFFSARQTFPGGHSPSSAAAKCPHL